MIPLCARCRRGAATGLDAVGGATVVGTASVGGALGGRRVASRAVHCLRHHARSPAPLPLSLLVRRPVGSSEFPPFARRLGGAGAESPAIFAAGANCGNPCNRRDKRIWAYVCLKIRLSFRRLSEP